MKRKRARRFPLTRLLAAALLGWLLIASGNAAIGAYDNVPAATLLLPYFEVDVSGQHAGNIMFTVHNIDAAPHLAHVTLWTDAGIPTFSFDVYLAGKDLVDIDLRAVFAGIVPHTSRTLSNEGAQSLPNVAFPGCDALLPAVRMTEQQIQDLRAAHTGQASGLWGGQCGSFALGDQMARGYITIDAVNRCSSKFPGAAASGGDPAYFVAGGDGIASNDNVLWGTYRIVDSNENQAYADQLVAIEADDAVESGYTFYGRRVNGNASDNRERLPGAWDARFIAGGAFQEASLQIWRDAGIVAPWACGGSAPIISHRQLWVFDEQENASVISDEDPTDGVVPLITRAASKMPVNGANGLPSPSDFGYFALDLGLSDSAVDPLFARQNQSHVSTVHNASGRFGGMVTAWPMNSGNVPHVDPPFPSLVVWLVFAEAGANTLFDPIARTLQVTAPAGTVQLRYMVRLQQNPFDPTRQVTGQVGQGAWAGPPAEAVKTATIPSYGSLWTNSVWGFHEVVAPFPDFQVQFFVPGGAGAMSYTLTVHYQAPGP